MRSAIILLTLLLITQATTAVSFSVRDNCQGGEEPLFSISNTTNANAGDVSTFNDYTGPYNTDGKVVCATDINPTTISTSCDDIPNPVLSFYETDTGQAHLSPVTERNSHVLCSQELATSVFRSCPGESKPIVSIYDPVENHVAKPGYYEYQICGSTFDNATLAYSFTMKGNTSFIRNNQETTGTETTTNTPAYAAVENETLISGIIGNDNLPQTVSIINNSFRAVSNLTVQGRTNLEWFLPLTRGDTADIEQRLDQINAGSFFNQFDPSFAYKIAEQAVVRVTLYLTSIDIVSDLELSQGFHQLLITNTGTANGRPQVQINATRAQ